MKEYFRRWLSLVFGVRYAKLTDHNGDTFICRVKSEAGYGYAVPCDFRKEVLRLSANGVVEHHHTHITKWEPYNPLCGES